VKFERSLRHKPDPAAENRHIHLFSSVCDQTFHRFLSRPSSGILQVPDSYLEDVITPAYNLLAEQLSKVGHGPIDHSGVKNYDDFNEIFWQEECLKLTVATMFDGKDSPVKKRWVCF